MVTFRINFKDPTLSKKALDLLSVSILLSFAEEENLYIFIANMIATESRDFDVDADTQHKNHDQKATKTDDMHLDSVVDRNQASAAGDVPPPLLRSATELFDKGATDDSLSEMI